MDEHGRRVLTAGEVFAERLRKVREQRDWSTRELARRVTELGHPMTHTAIWKIERGERLPSNIGLEDVLALSFALGVSPLYMICPVEGDDRLQVVSERPSASDIIARRWLRGLSTLHDEDVRFFSRVQPDIEKRWYQRAQDETLSDEERETARAALQSMRFERPTGWLQDAAMASDEEEERQ